MVDSIKSEGINVATPKKYADLDIFFTPHPVTGDITVKTDTDAVRRSVRNIILTNKFERPFKPNFGGSLRDMLFELDTMPKIKRVQARIIKTLTTFEPRVEDVEVLLEENDSNDVRCTIFYNITNGVSNQKVDFTVTRTR
jgi:phage baseplate assembly protein W|tara:strand:+ start:362 stop:781 length:420 start_codon:yes stop_codon:yes gene_type:complete